ncbi:aldo/keto reductase [Aquimarina algiphila]|uniref:aldo/keto reductase n=1 Tax=Aquimarina algiphila TaxID=2047982 RepID=UPI00232E6B6E|nr:aldo/keto reductase [Aquimarina algiphila]
MDNTYSSIGLGTAAIGRPQYINIRREENTPITLEDFRKKSWQTLEYAYQHGIRYFDTAPGYGLAEELLIDWVSSKNDSTIEIATKWGYTYTANFDPKATQHEIKEHSISKLNEQWQQSKKILPYLKMYQIHSATFESGVLENEVVLKRLAQLKSKHNLMIGVTTSGANQLEVIQKALEVEVEGNSLFDAFQITYNILDQSLLSIIKTIHTKNKKIVIKEALANGRLLPNNSYPNYQKLYIFLQELADKYQVGIDAIALRFCIDTVDPYKVLSGASNQSHVNDNLKSTTFVLDSKEIEDLQSFKSQPIQYWSERKKLSWN